MPPDTRRVLVAGVGNVLRGDDGFGPAVIAALEDEGNLPDGTRTMDLGTGGFAMLQELLNGYDALLIVDAVDRGGEPGSLYVLEPTVPSVDSLSDARRRELAADMHQAVPDRTLLMAGAIGALPPQVWIIGCQSAETGEFCMELSAPVRRAVTDATGIIRSIVNRIAFRDV